MEELGLQGDWRKVVDSLRAIADIYDRVNRAISFNTDLRLRAEGIRGFIGDGDRVLDLGCGNGVFSRVAESLQPNLGDLVMIDILDEMLRQIPRGGHIHPVQGVFENLPFRDSSFHAVITGFALRDAQDLRRAIDEVGRVALNHGGRLAVVDLGKPDSRIRSALIGFYWRVIAPITALLLVGRRGLEVSKIHTTYRRHPKTSQLTAILRQHFHEVTVREKMLGGIILMQARA